ncbi:hypothetical protein [Piscinibacter sp.]|uniref:hypothetical protein n=1 Tax=Piscinibacter sp. TaxID=1903157 RepID=UPI002B92F9A0|nr:hypothetical protein [Albitalea sp.]HUG22983.1 hypothetical protein [Albitalea sp.]
MKKGRLEISVVHHPFTGTTPPPQTKNVRKSLLAFESQEDDGILLHAAWRAAGITPQEPHKQPPDPTGLERLIAGMRVSKPDVRRFRASAPFTGRYEITPTDPWDGRTLPSVTLNLPGNIAVPLPSVARLDLLQSLRRIKGQVATAMPFLAEIAAQAEHPGVFFALALGMTTKTHMYTLDLMDAVNDIVAGPVHSIKAQLQLPRPSQFRTDLGSDAADPWIPDPWHTSYPSGHAAGAYALAAVLTELTGASSLRDDVARRIAKNREKAGVHSERDTSAGEQLGTALGQWMVAAAALRTPPYDVWAALFVLAANEWE